MGPITGAATGGGKAVSGKSVITTDDDGWMDGAWHAVSHDTLSGGIETISVPSDDEAFGGAYGVLGGKLVKITTAEDSAQPFWKSVKTRYHSKQSE